MGFQVLKFETKLQADGAQTFDLKEQNKFTRHQLQIEVSEQPSAGTMAVAVKSPGAGVYSLLDSTVDLTALTATNGKIIDIDVFAESIKITPSSLDAAKTYNAYLISKE